MPKTEIRARSPRWPNWLIVVGLTGSLGSGKSTVLKMFKKKGAFTLDADKMVHDLLMKNKVVKKQIHQQFGSKAMSQGRVNTRYLASLIFMSPYKRKKLERILHPLVRKRIYDELKQRKGRVAVCDVPLLFESGWQDKFDTVIVVTASKKERLRRLRKRGMTKKDILARFRAQWPLTKKINMADTIIHNNGSLSQTEAQVSSTCQRFGIESKE